MTFGRELAQARQIEREEIAALRGDQRVQLIEDDRVEIGEQVAAHRDGEQQRDLLRRRQQDVGRLHALALAACERTCRRCAFRCGP